MPATRVVANGSTLDHIRGPLESHKGYEVATTVSGVLDVSSWRCIRIGASKIS